LKVLKAGTKGEIPEEEVGFEDLYLNVSRKRFDIVTVAKLKKSEQMFKNSNKGYILCAFHWRRNSLFRRS
jgi:hypothetical protein